MMDTSYTCLVNEKKKKVFSHQKVEKILQIVIPVCSMFLFVFFKFVMDAA